MDITITYSLSLTVSVSRVTSDTTCRSARWQLAEWADGLLRRAERGEEEDPPHVDDVARADVVLFVKTWSLETTRARARCSETRTVFIYGPAPGTSGALRRACHTPGHATGATLERTG